MTRYRWRGGNVSVGLVAYVLGSALGSIFIPSEQQAGWVILITLVFVGVCMATERGEWRWWQKLAMLPFLWVVHAALTGPVVLAFGPILVTSHSLLAGADLVIALIAGVPVVLVAMRRSRWFVEGADSPSGRFHPPWQWSVLGWIFVTMGVLGYVGQGTLFLLIEYVYISQNWTFIFNPLGYIQTLFTMLRLPVFWVFLALAVLGYLGMQWTERRMEAFGKTSSFTST